MLSLIIVRSIHQEAREPTFHVINHVMKLRWGYLGHILQMDENRALRKYLLELQPSEPPFTEGSLLEDTNFSSLAEMIEAASDRDQWRDAQRTRRNNLRW